MDFKKELALLLLIFGLTVGSRIFFVMQSPYFSDSTSYFHLRQIEHIKNTGLPIYNDDLSYSGRFYVFLPFFHYFIAFFALFMPTIIAAKIISNILISTLVIVGFLIAKKITRSSEASISTALISGFVPLFYDKLNILSEISLVLPVSFIILFFFMKIADNVKYIWFYLVFLLVIVISHNTAFLILISLIVYLFFVWLEGLNPTKIEKEPIMFTGFFVVWVNFIVFKNVFLTYGPRFVWQNIPSTLINRYFLEFNLWQAIYQIGIIPFLLGVYVIYKFLFVQKNRNIYLLISFAISSFLLLWLKLIPLDTGFVYFSVVLTLLFSQAFKSIFAYINKTKVAKYKIIFILVFLVVFILTSFIPSMIYAKQSTSEATSIKFVQAMEWIKQNTEEDAVILSTFDEGHLITYFSHRKNVADDNFLLQDNAEDILKDINKMYTTPSETEAIRLLNKYDVAYILFSKKSNKTFGSNALSYTKDDKCFELVYNKEIKVFKPLCKITVQK